MEFLLEILLGVGCFVGGFLAASIMLWTKPGQHATEEVAEILHLAQKHEHEYHIAGKAGKKIQYECSGCGRVRFE